MSVSSFIASSSLITASSYDNVSAECAPNRCNPRQSTDDGFTLGMDDTFWQSKAEFAPKCSPVWIQYDLTEVVPEMIYNMSIHYGELSFKFDGQTQGNVKVGPEVTITSVSGASTNAVAGKDYTFQSTVASDEEEPFRLDAFLPLTDLMTRDVKIVRFTWNNLVPQGSNNLCQMNADEVVIFGKTENANAMNNTSASGLSNGAIAGIAVGSLVVLVGVVLLIVRARNVARRKASMQTRA